MRNDEVVTTRYHLVITVQKSSIFVQKHSSQILKNGRYIFEQFTLFSLSTRKLRFQTS